MSIRVYYTRTSRHATQFKLPAGFTATPGRPQFSQMMDEIVGRTCALRIGDINGIAVATCGPEGLVESVRLAQSSVGWQKRRRVGGLELITETFSW